METIAEKQLTDRHSENAEFGFWIYLMTDLVTFSVLFATYAVLKNNTFGGPSGRELFNLPFVLGETLILLTSSFTSGLAMLSVRQNKKNQSLAWFGTTFLLGTAFLVMESTEFRHLLSEGNGPQRNAFLSSFFALVGTHGLHIAIGLLWMCVSMAMVQVRGLTEAIKSKLHRLSLFWHFLDIVWIFIFTIVYLLK